LSLSGLQIDLLDNANKSKGIFIQQIGNSNHLNANTKSISSSINLFQYGNDNEINLNINAVSIKETVVQKGNEHIFFDISLKKTLSHTANVLQVGKNQRLYWQGANSLSEKMFISMKGNNQTILIRNIK
ncbi:MAG: hypothetical protein KUG68_06850, partial [Flavobacteriaceae bacterium]|nr:hypothetical protein [Flavobacteriaceae bacterium]